MYFPQNQIHELDPHLLDGQNLFNPNLRSTPTQAEDNKAAEIAKKVFLVLGVALAGTAITIGATIALAPLGPIAIIAAAVTGATLTILATALTIYLVTRPKNPAIETPYGPLQTTSSSESIPSPMDVIDQIGHTPQSVGKRLAEEAIAKFDALQAPMSGHKVEDYAEALIESENRYKLSLLNQKLKNEVGTKIASTIMSDWDLIGHDIRTNKTLLNDERISEILAHAKRAQSQRKDKEHYAQELRSLREKLASGEMPARKLVIEKNFPLLADLIANDSQRKKELDTLLMEAAVKQQIRKGPLFQPSQGEKDIFDRLGLPLEHIDPLKIPQSLSQKIALVLLESSPFFEDNEDAFISEVRKHLKKHAIEERIDQMMKNDPSGRSEKAKARMEQVLDLISLRDHLNGRMLQQRKQVINTLIDSLEEINTCEDVELKKFMRATVVTQVNKNSRLFLNEFLNRHKADLDDAIDGTGSVQKYHERLEEIYEEYLNAESHEIVEALTAGTKNKLPELYEWYDKWIDSIKKPFAQGSEDSNEALGEGVCYAMSLRLIAHEMTHPNASDEQVARQVQIKPQDRFFQALYSASKDTHLDNKILAHVGLKNYQKIDQFPKINEDLFDQDKLLIHLSEMVTNSENSKDTNGVCSIGITGCKISDENKITKTWAHSIHTRIDVDRGIYRLFDPNYGLLSFDSESELVECLQDLIKSAYPDTILATVEAYEVSD